MAASLDHVRLLVAVMVVRGEGRGGLEAEEERDGAAGLVAGEALHLDAGNDRLPASFIGADGGAVLRRVADRGEDLRADAHRRRDRLDRLGDELVERRGLFDGEL